MTLVIRHDLLTLEGCRSEAWRLLGRIATQVTDAPGQTLGSHVSSGKPESRPPRAVGTTLAEVWIGRFNRSWDDARQLRTDCIVGGAVLARELGQLDSWAREHLLTDAGFAIEHDADLVLDRVATCYVGWAPHEVAGVESAIGTPCDASWVRKLRRRCALHPETGHPVPVGDQLVAEVVSLHAAGRSLRAIGQELGISKDTADRILKADRGDAPLLDQPTEATT